MSNDDKPMTATEVLIRMRSGSVLPEHRIDESARALFKADLLRLCTGICVDTAKYMRDRINKEDLDACMLEAVNDFLSRWT